MHPTTPNTTDPSATPLSTPPSSTTTRRPSPRRPNPAHPNPRPGREHVRPSRTIRPHPTPHIPEPTRTRKPVTELPAPRQTARRGTVHRDTPGWIGTVVAAPAWIIASAVSVIALTVLLITNAVTPHPPAQPVDPATGAAHDVTAAIEHEKAWLAGNASACGYRTDPAVCLSWHRNAPRAARQLTSTITARVIATGTTDTGARHTTVDLTYTANDQPQHRVVDLVGSKITSAYATTAPGAPASPSASTTHPTTSAHHLEPTSRSVAPQIGGAHES